ncbi:MAG: HD family hydrolase [Candidatus Thorarchaeota archaeon]
MTEPEDIIELIKYGISLKRINRMGWSLAGVNCIRTESVAEHTMGSVLTSMLVSQYLKEKGTQLNVEKVITMAVIHDLPEALTSDIPRTANQSLASKISAMKQLLEREAVQEIFSKGDSASKYYIAMWEEFEEGSTLESRIVKGSDIIDMLMHALSLESSGVSPELLHQFFSSSKEIIESLSIDLLNEIYTILLERHLQNEMSQKT